MQNTTSVEPPLVVIPYGRSPFTYNEKLNTLVWQRFPISRIKWRQDVTLWRYIWQSFVAWSLIYQNVSIIWLERKLGYISPIDIHFIRSTSALSLYLMNLLNNLGRIHDSPQEEVPNLFFCPNFRKLHEIEKKVVRGDTCPRCLLLGSANPMPKAPRQFSLKNKW